MIILEGRELDLKHGFTRHYTPRAKDNAGRFIPTVFRALAYACSHDKLL
jgi:hypothetical protein